MPSSSPLAFARKERVFCLDDGLLFEAKVLESRLSHESDENSAHQYYVHYLGYKKVWDAWVPQDRLYNFNDENRELAKKLKKDANQPRQRAVQKRTATPSKTKAADFGLASPSSSDERNSLVPAAGQRQKRKRNTETENVGTSKKLKTAGSNLKPSSSSEGSYSPVPAAGREKKRKRDDFEKVDDVFPSPIGESPLILSSEASPGLPGNPKIVRRNNSRANSRENRSSLHFTWGEPEPPTKRPRPSFPIEPPSLPFDNSKPTQAGFINLMRLRPEYGPTKNNPWARPHPAISKDPRANEAKRLFYRGQDPATALMVAGVPLEAKEAMFQLEAKPVGGASKKQGRHTKKKVQKEEAYPRPSVCLDVSLDLMPIIVDDWESITECLSAIPLPSAYPVSKILDTYFDEENSNLRPESAEAGSLDEFVGFFKGLFQGYIGVDLVHCSMEPEQLEEVGQRLWKNHGDKWEAGDAYGAEYLARMLAKMPELIAESAKNDKIIGNLLQNEVTKLARWLSRNSARFFVSEYEVASMESIEKACGNQAAVSPTEGERRVSKRTKKNAAKGTKYTSCSRS